MSQGPLDNENSDWHDFKLYAIIIILALVCSVIFKYGADAIAYGIKPTINRIWYGPMDGGIP